MDSKNIMIDFIQYLVFIGLVLLIIFYVILGDRFFILSEIVLSFLVPVAIFGVGFLIKYRLMKKEIQNRKEESSTSIELYLDYSDKLISDILLFSLPIVVLLLALMIKQEVTKDDLIQAVAVFSIGYYAQHSLFKKRN